MSGRAQYLRLMRRRGQSATGGGRPRSSLAGPAGVTRGRGSRGRPMSTHVRPYVAPPPAPIHQGGGRCRLFNSFICRNDCRYQSRVHRPAEEVKVSPQEDKPQKTILCMICAFFLQSEKKRHAKKKKKIGESVGKLEEERETISRPLCNVPIAKKSLKEVSFLLFFCCCC